MGLEHSLFAVAAILGPGMGLPLFQYGEALDGQGISALHGSCGLLFLTILGIWLVSREDAGKAKLKAN